MSSRLRELSRTLKRALLPGGEIAGRTVTSGVWMMLLNVVDRGLQLLMVVFVARLIGPEEFGLMGIALLTLSALKRLTELGLDTALIQRREENVDEYLNTAWSIQILRGAVLAAIAYSVAPSAAAFLGEPRATPLIRLIGFTTLIRGLANPGVMYLQKNLEFHKEFVYTLSGRFVYVGFAVGYAIVHQSVWALVFGHLAGSLTNLVVSYVIHDYRPRPAFDVGFAKELLNYGKWIFGSSILTFLGNEGDDVFVSWFLGAASLGVYQLAYQISNAPATEITHTISRVVFPAYSKLQGDLDSLRAGFFTTMQFIAFVSFPTAVGIAVVMPSFVEAFLGEDWLAMILPAQVLAVYGLLHSFRTAAVPLFRAVGRPDLDTKIRVVKLAVIVVLVYPAAQAYGLVGVSLVIVANSLVANPITHYLAVRIVDGRFVDFLHVLAYPAAGSVAMGVCVLAVQRSVAPVSPLAEFGLSVAVGVAAYAITMLVVDRWFAYDMRRILSTIRSSFA